MYIAIGTPHVYRVQVPPFFKGYDSRTSRNSHITSGHNDTVDPLDAFQIKGVVPNRERNLFLIWSSSTFYLWNCRPAIQLFALSRSPESVAEFGEIIKVIWKSDSSAIAVATDKNYLLFFSVELERSSGGFLSSWTGQKRFEKSSKVDDDFLPWTSIVALQIVPSFHIKTDGIVEDFCCIREELLVALSTGGVQRISWSEGLVNFGFSFNINDVPFGLELQHFRGSVLSPSNQHSLPKTFVKGILYSSLLAGFVITLADGRAGFITSPTLRFEPNKLQAVWAREVFDATGCQSVNNYYRLLCFGLTSGRVAVYCIGERTGSLDIVHKLEVSSADCPDAHSRCGAVAAMSWSPDDRVLAVAWEREGIAVYSVFGSLLFLSLTSLPTYCAPIAALQGASDGHVIIRSLDWSPEGYQVWLVPRSGKFNFATLSFAKSALTRNPCESNHLHVLMQSDDCLFVGLVDRLHSPNLLAGGLMSLQNNLGVDNMPQSASVGGDGGPAMALSVVPIAPGLAYLGDNWPITYSCISEAGDWLAVAGRTGLACFSLKRRQWKLFGNISQERDFYVTGGLVLWREFVVAIAYNLAAKRDELRFYPLTGRLDNASSTVHRLETQAMMLNCVQDMLIVFTVDSVVSIFYLRKRFSGTNSGSTSSSNSATVSQGVERHKLVEINIGQFLAHPATVTHITLTTLSTDIVLLLSNSNSTLSSPPGVNRRTSESLTKSNSFNSTANSLLVTTSGRVLLLQADRPIISPSQSNSNAAAIFSTPVRIAENVEHLWLMACDPINNAALAETIWLYCGKHGANVWLPLVNATKADARSQAFLSKRVMLQVDCPIYPLTALLSVAAVVGAASETTASAFLPLPFSGNKTENGVSSNRITRFEAIRTSHSYLPSILRQLLRRHLGLQALEVTRSWSHLANFPHVLELLLHQVVDEEAMSKEPLPDPLLPRVVAFIQQFPEHSPAVVVQCARKMEAILWPYLFATVGPPRDLFADCLRRGDLDTAVSYLIILHTTEQSTVVSRQLTSELLTAVLETRRWSLAQDILRFLRSIGSSCLEPAPAGFLSPRLSKSLDRGNESMLQPLTPGAAAQSQQWQRLVPIDDDPVQNASKQPARVTPPPPPQSNLSQQQSIGSKEKEEVPVDIDLTERVVYPYLHKLVVEKRLLDLGRLAAAVHSATRGFSLASWLLNERQKSPPGDGSPLRLADFVAALHRLHSDFEWPYPVLVHPPQGSALRNSQSNIVIPNQNTNEPSIKFRVAPAVDDIFPTGENDDVELVPKFSVGGKDIDNAHFVTSHVMGDNNSDSGSILSHSESLQSLMSADGVVAVPPPNTVQVMRTGGMLQVYRHEQHLRFLFRIMLEATWYDWALLLSIILRDAKLGVESVRGIVALMSTEEREHNNIGDARAANVNSNGQQMPSPALLSMVRDICIGFNQFVSWAGQACSGYLAFAHVMDPQIRRLSYLLAQSPPTSPPHSRSESPKPAADKVEKLKRPVAVAAESLPATPAPQPSPQIPLPSSRPMSAAPTTSATSTSQQNGADNGARLPGKEGSGGGVAGAHLLDPYGAYGGYLDDGHSYPTTPTTSTLSLNPEDILISSDHELRNTSQSAIAAGNGANNANGSCLLQ